MPLHSVFFPDPPQSLQAPIVYEQADAEHARLEYRLVRIDAAHEEALDEERLNLLGIAGWLLVSALRYATPAGGERLDYLFVRAA